MNGVLSPYYYRRSTSFKFKLANSLVLKKIHGRIGLDQLKMSLSGAAPIQAKTIEFFMSINIPVLELYGMSENSGPHSFNTLHEWRLRSVGHSMCGTYLKIDNPDENGEGEVCEVLKQNLHLGLVVEKGRVGAACPCTMDHNRIR